MNIYIVSDLLLKLHAYLFTNILSSRSAIIDASRSIDREPREGRQKGWFQVAERNGRCAKVNLWKAEGETTKYFDSLFCYVAPCVPRPTMQIIPSVCIPLHGREQGAGRWGECDENPGEKRRTDKRTKDNA